MQLAIQLLVSHTYPFIDSEGLAQREAPGTLFRMPNGSFLLHLSASDRANDDDRAAACLEGLGQPRLPSRFELRFS